MTLEDILDRLPSYGLRLHFLRHDEDGTWSCSLKAGHGDYRHAYKQSGPVGAICEALKQPPYRYLPPVERAPPKKVDLNSLFGGMKNE